MSQRPLRPDAPLLLGSESPRRREILSGLSIPIEVCPLHVDEDVGVEGPEAFVAAVVAAKLAAVEQRLQHTPGRYPAALVADTIVVLDGEVLNKPRDRQHARELLGKLAGRTHTVFTRYAIWTDGETVERTVESRVSLRPATDEVLARYADTGEGLDKAGAYAVQGIGSFLVRAIEGSYSNVVGLPACEVVEDLTALGLLPDFPERTAS